jgi:uncharacterized membrane protein YecN with MAPEG domain
MEVTPQAHAAALWTGLNLILLLVLSVRVVRERRRQGVALGDAEIPELARAVRAFGNAAEYIPAGLVGLAILAFAGAPPALVHLAGLILFAGRLAHALGLSRSGGPSRARSFGATLTWVAYLLIAVALLFYAIP